MPLPVVYKGVALDADLRLDIVTPARLVLELKAVDQLLPIREAQLLTYLKLSGIHLGLLINFNVPLLKDGIRRRVVRLPFFLILDCSLSFSVLSVPLW